MTILIYGNNFNIDWNRQFDRLPDNFKRIFTLNNITETDIIIGIKEENIIDIINQDLKCKKFVPSLFFIDTFWDKKKFYHFCIENDLEEYIPKHFNNISEISGTYIVKRRKSSSGIGSYISSDFISDSNIFENNIIQEFIFDNKDYVTHFVAKDGVIIFHFTFECLMKTDKEIRGISGCYLTYTNIIQNSFIIDIFSKFLKSNNGNYTGIGNIDYKIDKDGIPKVFEINPRMGGSLMNENYLTELIVMLECCE